MTNFRGMLITLLCLGCSMHPSWGAETPPEAPQIHDIPAVWPWGAKIDESVFGKGGIGRTIYASPTGKATAAGSEADPLDVPTACKQLEIMQRSYDIGFTKQTAAIT